VIRSDKLIFYRRIFRNNFELEEINDDIKDLCDLGLIELCKTSYVKCVNRSDNDYLDLTEDQKACDGKSYVNESQELVECNYCNRQLILENKKKFEVYLISIVYNGIIEFLREKIGKENTAINENNSHIIYTDEKEINHTICVLDLCNNIECKSKFYYSDEIIYVYCDVAIGFSAANVIWLFDLLVKESDQLIAYIKATTPKISANKVKFVMENLIDKMSWQNFEDFIPQLLNNIRENPNNYNDGFSRLERYSGTVLSSFSVKLGGPRSTDAYSINLFDYYQLPLKSRIRIECKHSEPSNIDSSVSIDDLRELMDHAFLKEGVIFTNRKKIDSSAMNRCIELKEANRHWKFNIIHRPLLKLFISLFTSNFWNNPESIFPFSRIF
jgi:hypothetical protein